MRVAPGTLSRREDPNIRKYYHLVVGEVSSHRSRVKDDEETDQDDGGRDAAGSQAEKYTRCLRL
jgi:hypothetical protein